MPDDGHQEGISVLVLPVINDDVRLPLPIPIPLTEHLSFEPVTGDHLIAITEDDASASAILRGGVYTLACKDSVTLLDPDKLESAILAAAFSLCVIAERGGLSFEKGYLLSDREGRLRIVNTRNFSGLPMNSGNRIEFGDDTDFADASSLYTASIVGMQNHSPMKITLSRFCSALSKDDPVERVVDLCIALGHRLIMSQPNPD